MKAPVFKREDEIERKNSRQEQGIDDTDLNRPGDRILDLNVYPSPAHETVHIDYGHTAIEEILIFNADGKVVKQVKNPGPIRHAVLVKDWADGVYFAQIKSSSGEKKTMRFVVEWYH